MGNLMLQQIRDTVEHFFGAVKMPSSDQDQRLAYRLVWPR
jgi:hypothetical protein